jgi:hypothetical protein
VAAGRVTSSQAAMRDCLFVDAAHRYTGMIAHLSCGSSCCAPGLRAWLCACVLLRAHVLPWVCALDLGVMSTCLAGLYRIPSDPPLAPPYTTRYQSFAPDPQNFVLSLNEIVAQISSYSIENSMIAIV